MGLFDRFKKRDDTPETTPTTPTQDTSTQVATDVLLQALLNNEAITREQALTLPAVSGAVNLISSMIASMPIKLYKYKQGKVETVEDDDRVKLLNGHALRSSGFVRAVSSSGHLRSTPSYETSIGSFGSSPATSPSSTKTHGTRSAVAAITNDLSKPTSRGEGLIGLFQSIGASPSPSPRCHLPIAAVR